MLRSLAGKTQEDIAEVIGISRQAYAKWERGETIPDIEKCSRLAEFYGVTMDSLIKDDVQLEGQKMAPAPKGKHMWGVVTVNDRGQIVIPKEARDTFGLVNGSRLVVLGVCVFEYVLSGRGHIERNGSILTVNAGDAYILTAAAD